MDCTGSLVQFQRNTCYFCPIFGTWRANGKTTQWRPTKCAFRVEKLLRSRRLPPSINILAFQGNGFGRVSDRNEFETDSSLQASIVSVLGCKSNTFNARLALGSRRAVNRTFNLTGCNRRCTCGVDNKGTTVDDEARGRRWPYVSTSLPPSRH